MTAEPILTDAPQLYVAVANSDQRDLGGYYLAGWTKDGQEVRVRLYQEEADRD